jgi:alpha-galactosidase
MPFVVGMTCALPAVATAQQLTETPPMAWNDYNHFKNHLDNADVRAVADATVSSGMRDAGYV